MSVVPQNEQKSPKISRFITEAMKAVSSKQYFFIFFMSGISGLLIVAISVQVILMKQYQEKEQLLIQERKQVSQQIDYWAKVIAEYPDYRDAYYQLAKLEYRLGNGNASRQQLEKVLTLDPQFEQGKVLGAKIGL